MCTRACPVWEHTAAHLDVWGGAWYARRVAVRLCDAGSVVAVDGSQPVASPTPLPVPS